MQVRYLMASLVILLCFASLGAADGMVYQLPADGVWAKFSMEGFFLGPDEKKIGTDANITGTLTISSVGTVKLEDVPCRWIEIMIDAQSDGKAFKEVDKLLIPETELTAGKQPLEHVRDAWYMHSSIDSGKPRHIADIHKLEVAYIQRIRPILHPPFVGEKKLDKTVVDCKLGKVECEGMAAEETEKHEGSDIQYNSSYTIYLHPKAPFGVAAWQTVNRVRRGEELLGTRKLQMTLIDFGKDAKSCISDGQ
jgi:hypothetical protein